MYEIRTSFLNSDYAACWHAAREHLNRQVDGGIQSWINAALGSPTPEQFSFRLGNQLFLVSLESCRVRWEVPDALEALLRLAKACNGHACVMPMVLGPRGWVPINPGWGLLDARTRRLMDPISLVTDEPIEMSDWELHDFAVQVVRDQLRRQGYVVTSRQGSPGIEPSIWLDGATGPEWVVVRAARHPEFAASPPKMLDQITEQCRRLGTRGYFASVAVASGAQDYDLSAPQPIVPLYRGHGMHVRYAGLAPIGTRH